MLKGNYLVLDLDLLKEINNSVQRILLSYKKEERIPPDKLFVQVEGDTDTYIIYIGDEKRENYNISIEEVRNISKQNIETHE